MRAQNDQPEKPTKNISRKAKVPSTAASLGQKRVERAYKKMGPELVEKLDKIRSILRRSRAHELEAKCTIGRIVNNVQKVPKKYGKNGVESLAKALGLDASSLYDYAKAAKGWSKDEILELKKRPSVTGVPISFSHLLELSILADKSEREDWIKKVLEQGLSVRALRQSLKQGTDARVEEQEPREIPVLQSWARPLQELTASTETLLQQVQRVDHMLASLPSDTLDASARELLEKTMHAQTQLSNWATDAIAKIHAVLSRKTPDGREDEQAIAG